MVRLSGLFTPLKAKFAVILIRKNKNQTKTPQKIQKNHYSYQNKATMYIFIFFLVQSCTGVPLEYGKSFQEKVFGFLFLFT